MGFNNITPMIRNLLILNIGIFVVQYVIGPISLPELFGYRYINSESFRPYQFFTYMFIHGGGWHLFGNMFALFVFGPLLEQHWGPKKFLFFYMITGLGAGALYALVNFIEVHQMEEAALSFMNMPSPEQLNYFINEFTGGYQIYKPSYQEEIYDFVNILYPEEPLNQEYINRAIGIVKSHYQLAANQPMVGASGSIFGILMAFGMLFPNMELMLIFPPIPVKAKYLVLAYGGYSVYALLENNPGDNVAHLAHLGGMLFAFIILKIWQKQGEI